MFQEVLRIKPVLEPAATAKMETTLSQRFKRVTKSFGAGLKAVVTGTALGIGLNILAKILNPITELEDRLNTLLGKGKNILDQSDRFGTSSGKLARLQVVGERLGVSPEDLGKLMEKYAEAIETGREEIKKPLKDQSDATKILSKDFLQEKDIAESFFKFIQSLKFVTDQDQRKKIEKEVLGESLFGFKRRFTDADFTKEFKTVPDTGTLGKAVGNVAATDEELRIKRVNRETQDFLKNANTLGPGTVNAISALEQKRSDKDNKDFSNINQMAVAARGLEESMALLQKPLQQLQTGIANLVTFTEQLSKSRWFRNIIGSK